MPQHTHDAAQQAFLILRSKASRYALAGTVIAIVAVILATVLVSLHVYDGITVDNILRAHRENVAIWALDAMPFLFGIWGQYASIRMAREAGTMVDSSTQGLREELEETRYTAQTKTDFFARMSHELRTPLNAIIGMSEMLQNESDASRRKEHTRVIQESARGLLTLVNDVLDFSRIEAGRLELDEVNFDLHQHLNGIAALMRPQAEAKGLRLLCLVPRNAPRRVMADPGRLRQILINLVGNAIKFTDHGEVVISLREWDELDDGGYRLQFEVADSGIGIRPADQKKLFDAYRQVGRNSQNGSGLGLSITRELIHAMNGVISVESEPGKGSVFRFSAQVGSAMPKTGLAGAIDLTGKTLLLADADTTAREILAGQLRALGLSVTTASDGIEAMQEALRAAAAAAPFDLLLTDMSLPYLSGEALGQRLKERPQTRSTCLAIMTSAGVRGDAQRLNSLGFAGYLMRPLPPEHLQPLLQAILFTGQMSEKDRQSRGVVTRFDLPRTATDEGPLLVVDDSPANREILLHQIAALNLQADGVEGAAEALSALHNRRYSLILADLRMPDMPGDELIHAIEKMADQRSHTPVLILTAGATAEERRRCTEAGAAGILTKPVPLDDLRQALSAHVTIEQQVATTGEEDTPTLILRDDQAAIDPELAEIFLTEAEQRMTELRDCIHANSQDPATIVRHAHALKSASRHFPGNSVGTAAEQLETAAESDNVPGMRASFQDLEEAWVFLHSTLETAIADAAPTERRSRPGPDA